MTAQTWIGMPERSSPEGLGHMIKSVDPSGRFSTQAGDRIEPGGRRYLVADWDDLVVAPPILRTAVRPRRETLIDDLEMELRCRSKSVTLPPQPQS